MQCEFVTKELFEKLLDILFEKNILTKEEYLRLKNTENGYVKIDQAAIPAILLDKLATQDYVDKEIAVLHRKVEERFYTELFR